MCSRPRSRCLTPARCCDLQSGVSTSAPTLQADGVQLLDPDFQDDPFPALAAHRAQRPVFEAADLPVWLLTRYDDVAGMRDEAIYSTSFIKAIREPIDGSNMMQMDGEVHHRNRALIAPAFRTRVISAFVDAHVRPIVARLVDRIRDQGSAELMRELCEPLPFFAIADLLGLDAADQPRLSSLYKDAIAADPLQAGPEQMERALAARAELDLLLVPLVERRRHRPTDDFISQLVTAESATGDSLDDDEVLGFLRFMLPAGEESTMSALGTLVLELLRRPEQLEAVRSDPSLIPSAVEEALRWRAPVAYINRVTLVEQSLSGATVPEGALVLGCVNAANRDSEAFPRPNQFDVRRRPNKHLSFGTGVHTCIGAALARAELHVALGALLDLPGLRLADGYEPRYAGVFSNAIQDLPVVLE
jgi:cytochrome P450